MADDRVAQAALDRAIEDNEQLLLLYQPIHDARSGAIVAAEALVRQRRQSGEIREASIITETAEEGPELFVLDSLLMRKAFSAATQFTGVRLHVNLSPREFEEGNIVDRLTGLIAACGIETHRISLEITETSYIERPEETMEVLAELKRRGFELWLDDFGTGHSSLTHLQHFPLHGLKIAGTFVRDMVTDTRCEAITRALIALAHELGMQVIAEEVETRDQLAVLRDLDCDRIQGFLFSRPMELDAFSRTLGMSNEA